MVAATPSPLELITDLNREIKQRRDTEKLLAGLLKSVGGDKQLNFFQSLAVELSKALDVSYVLIGLINSDHRSVTTIAVSGNGKTLENFSYDLLGTPCQDVADQGVCIHPRSVQELYPLDHLLVQMGIESYFGVPLLDHQQTTIGLLVALDCKPLPDHKRLQLISIFTVFATRCSAELEHQRLLAGQEALIAARTADLAAKNRQLEQTLAALESTEQALIESEQLALLGDLVGGIVDEVNAPLAMASTALSCLEEQHKRLDHYLQGHQLTLSQFAELIGEHGRALGLLKENMQRVSVITEHFGHVAKRPAPNHRSTVNIRALIDDVVLTFSHQLKQRGHQISANYLGQQQFQGYPALFAQIVAQLFQMVLAPQSGAAANGNIDLTSDCDDHRWRFILAFEVSVGPTAPRDPDHQQGATLNSSLLALIIKRAGGKFHQQHDGNAHQQLTIELPLLG